MSERMSKVAASGELEYLRRQLAVVAAAEAVAADPVGASATGAMGELQRALAVLRALDGHCR